GAVVYLNGEEIMRAHMPEGKVTPATPAEPYPKRADYMPDGFTLPHKVHRAQEPEVAQEGFALRTREISNAVIPADKLRKGANFLAIGLHRAPIPAERFVTVRKGHCARKANRWWTRLGLVSIEMKARPDSAVVANVEPRSGQGFGRWNQSIVQKVSDSDYPDPFDTSNPVEIIGTRNGSFSGQIVVGDEKPIKGLSVKVSDLNGPGVIPGSAVLVRYARPDGSGATFDSLDEIPPAEVPTGGKYGRSVQPIWLTVRVPADAGTGSYEGMATITAEGIEPHRVKLKVNVSGYRLPPSKEFPGRMDLIQSPESVAMAYDVPLWSDKHFALLDKSFALVGGVGGKTLYITCIRRTHFGNEHAMVRWTRDENFELQPDFTIVEKYLDTAIKHLGRVPGVILYCWEPPHSQGHAGGTGRTGKIHDKPILYTLYDPETGEYTGARGPAWGTPEAKEFWKKLTDGIQPVLEKRGLKDSMLFGLAGDHRPTKQAMDDICNGVKDAEWAIHSHYLCGEWQGYKMGMFIALWGISCGPADPSQGYAFGWSNPRWLAYYPRKMSLKSSLTEYRCMLEAWIGARNSKWPSIATRRGPKGLGRLGADFWEVMKDSRGRARGTLAGRYPESAWGQLNLNFGVPRIFGIGKEGPVATARSEAFRSSTQEIEARVYLEKVWLDSKAPQIIGEDMVKEIRSLLDERIRVVNIAQRRGDVSRACFISSGWKDRNQRLFDLAAEVQKKYGKKQPDPDLDRERKEGDAE
ncbi:MAG: glycoside hydrolase domain-containing protein, partial [Verrucomicrobiota bacterium]